MRRTLCPLAGILLFFLVLPVSAQNVQQGLRVPDGFEVTEFADSKLANDIFCMTLDPKGRPVVSGPGYLRILVDDDNKGQATRGIDIPAGIKEGAQGLLWEGDSLFYMADGGLRRCRVDTDGKVTGHSELIRALKTGGEHNAHAIKRGPDGWLYLLCGNSTGIDRSFAELPTSPIREPLAGCVLRLTPDLKKCEIVADGYRNAYDMDFNLDGELFTFDSDNERCVSLPWYEPIRFYHVIPGDHYGWQSPQRAQWWRCPPYFCDIVAPIATMGRGSPTGVACYRHVQFPEQYRGGMFLLDWTFGRVYFVALKRSGSTYAPHAEVFLEAVGDNGFAPTALAVHPGTGDLYISIGGRGTRGAVYRIRYAKGLKPGVAEEAARLRMQRRTLDWKPALAKTLPEQAVGEDAMERLRALTSILRHRSQFNADQLLPVIRANWDHRDRYVRKATADLIATLAPEDRKALGNSELSRAQLTTYCLGCVGHDPANVLTRIGQLPPVRTISPGFDMDIEFAVLRLFQLALGDLMSPKVKGTIWEGYTPRQAKIDQAVASRALARFRTLFPQGGSNWDLEFTRLLAMLEDNDADTLQRVARRTDSDSDPVSDIHYLTVLARMPAPRTEEITRQTVAALLKLDEKMTRQKLARDSHWPLRIAELQVELAAKDPALNAALLAHPEFGRPDHALFTRCPGFDRKRAAEVLLARAEKDAAFPWNGDIVGLLASLPADKSLPVLRRLWGQAGLEEAILPVLARSPQTEDRAKFLHGLNSPQPATVRLSLESLEKLPGTQAEALELLALVRALRRLGDSKDEKLLGERLGNYLQRLTGEKLGSDKQRWVDWFSKAHPDLAVRLAGPDGVDVAAWGRRLARIDWTTGEPVRGETIFTKASCASCHSGGQALGPDLRGVAKRFSRDDLLTAIIQPSKDIAPRYRTTQVETADGKIYTGLIIYEAVGSLILQTGPSATIRLTDQQIAGKQFSDRSLMPAGLLDLLADKEIADLLAYLKGLGEG